MNINNNYSNNKQINFKANLICVEGVSEKLALRLAKIAKEARNTEGDIVMMRQKIVSNEVNSNLKDYITEFDYYRKDNIFSDTKLKINFDTLDGQRFNLLDRNAGTHLAENLDTEERDNKIVQFFQNIMASMPKK